MSTQIAPFTKTDIEIKQEIEKSLIRDPMIDAAAIGVAVESGVVTLTGHVPNFAQKRAAENIAQSARGVRGVAEELTVKLLKDRIRDDTDVAQAAVSALKWDVMVPEDAVKVTVEKGWVTLNGDVHFGFEKRAAEDAVRNLAGVRGVSNLLVVKPSVKPSDVKAEIERTFRTNAERDAEKVTVEAVDGVVKLGGTVRAWAEREDAARAAWNAPGVTRVENYIIVSA